MLMNIKPVRNQKAYRAALSEIESLMDAKSGTSDGDKLDVMVTLVEAYEAKAFPMELPDPIEAIRFEMERKGLEPKDLEPMIGQRNRVYEILNRTRPLTLPMIRRLHAGLGVPVECLVGR
jgi:HTH-type transcriptional regulator / antitoxin HigA